MTRSIVARKGHATTFVELFFDLVFVAAVALVDEGLARRLQA